MRPTNVAMHGWVWSRNFGDMLLFDMARRWLADAGVDQVTVPYAVEEVAGELGLGRGSGNTDALLLPGGGGFGLPPNARLRQRTNMFRQFLLPLIRARLSRKPYFAVGVGAGPFGGVPDEWLVRWLFEGAAVISVRDEESASFLTAAGVPSAKVEVTADLVLALTRDDLPAAAVEQARFLLAPLVAQAGPIVGVHLEGPPTAARYAKSHLVVAQLAQQMPDAVFALIIDNPGDASGPPPQQLAAEAVNRALPGRSMILAYPGHWTLAAALGQMDMILTNKLHVAITALALGRPAFAIAKHPKNLRLFRQLGIEDWCVGIGDARAAAIVETVKTIALNFATTDYVVPAAIRTAALRNRELVEAIAHGL